QTDVQSGALNVTDVTMSGPVRNREGASFSNTGGVLAGDLDNRGDAYVDHTNVTGIITNNGDLTSQSSQLADLENKSGTATLRNTLALNVTTEKNAELVLKDTVVRSFTNHGSFLEIDNAKVQGLATSADSKSDEDVLAGRSGDSPYVLTDRIAASDTVSNRDDSNDDSYLDSIPVSTNSGRTRARRSELSSVVNTGTLQLLQNSIGGKIVQNDGSLVIDNSKVLRLEANGGLFDVTSGGATVERLLGSGNGQLEGTLNLTKARDTYSGNISGTGNLTISGGTETLAGNNTYSGNTDIAQGAGLVLTGSLASTLNNNGTTDINGGTVTGATTNTSVLTAEKGTLADLANKSGGTATMQDSTAGHVTNDDGATFSATGGQLASAENSGTMTLGNGNTVTGDVIQKAGSLTLDGNKVDGTLAANGGQFHVADNGSTVGSLTGSGDGQLDGALNLTKANDTYAGSLSGNGGLTVSGGHEILTGNSSYAGPTLVQNDAQLTVNGDNSAAKGQTSVTDSATLRGNGTVGGNVAIGSGATLAAGTSEGPGRLRINGDLHLADGSRQVFRLGQANTEGGTYNDFVDVKGNLTLGGTLSVLAVDNAPDVKDSALLPGLYRLYSYGGVLSGVQQQMQLPSGNGDDLSLQTSIDHQVNLTVPSPVVPTPTDTAPPARNANFNFWDGNASSHRGADDAGNGKVDGGDGVWSAASPDGIPNWAESDGKTNGQWQAGNMAIFAASAGTVHVDDKDGQAPVSFSGAQFANNDGGQYLVTGDKLYASTDDTTIRVGDGTSEGKKITAEIASVIDGSHVDGGTGLRKTDFGTLILSSDNDFAKPTHIDAGTLQLGNGGTTGSVGTQEIVDNGTLAVDHSNDVTLAQPISGTGSFVQKGSGTTTLSGDNTYAGPTDVQDGRLNITGSIAGALNNAATTDVDGGKVAGLTTNSGTLTAENGTLADLDNSGKATLTGGQLASATNSGDLTLGKGNTATGDVTQNAGNLTLDGNKVDGTLAANGGQFHVTDNGSTVGSLTGAGNGQLDGILDLAHANDTYSGSLSGNGGLTLSNGQETLTNQSHLGGPVAVDNGTLTLTGSSAQLATDGGMTIGANGPSTVTLSNGAGLQSSKPVVFAKAETMPVDGFNATINVLDGSMLAAGDADGKPGLDVEDGAKARLNLDGGTLQNQKGSDLTSNVDTSIGSKGGTFDVQDQNRMTLGSNVSLTSDASSGDKAGTLTKTGTGSLDFDGDGSGFSGPTDIRAGQMIVDGNLSHSDMTVQKGAGLAGNGYVGSTFVDSGAALGGGNEERIGGLHVMGDLTMAKGSVLFIRGDNEATGQKLAEPDGFSYSELKSDRVLVSGKATLQGGTLDLQVKNPMALSYGQAYRVLTANAGVNGHYDDLKTNIGQDYAYLDPRLVYQDNDVDVVLRRSVYGFDHVGQTRNEITTGQGMNRIGDNTQLAQAMTVLTKDQARHALDNLSGELHASIRTG
ncbi:autotransporter-associated beta strand repeat-containing protein, partial [Acetobacteraceae bacterium B3987]|nr:autotransporter-associated beta strand repeat-containing protein [Acetobacteraceae bacterium B3987]